jgi:hypothetical protein
MGSPTIPFSSVISNMQYAMTKMVECRVNGRHYHRRTESIEMDPEKSILYINIVVIDASEAITNKVRARVEDSKLPKRLRRVVTAAATGIAGNVFTLEKIAKKVSKKICHTLPEKLLLRGITAVLEEIFREGPFVVFQLQVKHVDLATLTEKQLDKELKAAKGKDKDKDDDENSSKNNKDDRHNRDKKKKEGDTKMDTDADIGKDADTHATGMDLTTTTMDAAMTITTIQSQHVRHWFLYWLEQVLEWFLYWLEHFLVCIGASRQRRLEEDVLPALIHGKLEKIIGEILAEKIEEKFLDAESNVCSAAAQARYFFDTLKEVRHGDEKED